MDRTLILTESEVNHVRLGLYERISILQKRYDQTPVQSEHRKRIEKSMQEINNVLVKIDGRFSAQT